MGFVNANGIVLHLAIDGDQAAPALVLWARGGHFPREHFEDLAGRMQRGEVRDADAGHLVPMERPELVVGEVLRFSAR